MSIVTSLAEKGLLTSDQYQISVTESEVTGRSLEQTLVDLGFISAGLLRDVVGAETGAESVELAHLLPDSDALAVIPEQFARAHMVVPVSVIDDVVSIAMVDAQNLHTTDKLRKLLGANWQLRLLIASERDIADALDRYYGFELSIDGILHEIDTASAQSTLTDFETDSYRHPCVRLVDAILLDAVKRAASDIHFEPERGFLRIRFRIDGMLRQIRCIHSDHWAAMVVRLKVLSQLNIAESRAPQDGRMSFAIAGGTVEFRVSVLPTVYGENIVLRILDKDKGIVALDDLGLSETAVAQLNAMLKKPEGLILITGPTGSGKTTTLYSLLSRISNEQINIMTMEDPVEYPLPLLRQTSVNQQIKLDFASGIRAILRQDPDVILVGEIRDADTARMALRASMTGHQVFSTLHANSAIGALSRLHSLGVGKDELSGNLIAIIGQRLVRKLCEHCKQKVEDNPSGTAPGCQSVGCAYCDWQGYRGRVAVVEILSVSPDLESLFLNGASPQSLRSCAINNGFRPIAEDVLSKVRGGVTSYTEAARVVDLTADPEIKEYD